MLPKDIDKNSISGNQKSTGETIN